MRLGFSIRIYGRSDLPSHGEYRGEHGSDLGMNLAYLRDILYYLRDNAIHMYRLHSGLVPCVADPARSILEEQIKDYALELETVGDLARRSDVRLSFHPYSVVVLNGLNEDQVLRSVAHLEAQATMFEAMGLGPEAVIVLHVGGVYDNPLASRERFIRRYEALPEAIRRRLVLENDDHRFSHADVRAIHRACGIPLVFDALHHLVHNPEGVPMREALEYATSTWPARVVPKVHFSSPRTEMRTLEGSSRIKVPTWTEHSDFVNPFDFMAFMSLAAGMIFDVMLESKARDLALLKLREDLCRFSPDLARQIG
jgi:UV DNA damage endonuclease